MNIRQHSIRSIALITQKIKSYTLHNQRIMKARIDLSLLTGRSRKRTAPLCKTEGHHDEKHRRAARIRSITLEVGLIACFLAGYYLDPVLLRYIWLVFFGTLIVLCGIYFYLT